MFLCPYVTFLFLNSSCSDGSLADFGLTLEAGPFCRRKTIDLTNMTKLVELHSLSAVKNGSSMLSAYLDTSAALSAVSGSGDFDQRGFNARPPEQLLLDQFV
jgi:hypothetical protein